MQRISIGLGIVALALIAASIAIRAYMSRDVELSLQPTERVSIRDLRDPLPDNSFLACPPGYCQASAATSPIFAISPDKLVEITRRVMAEEGQVFVVDTLSEMRGFTAIQRTPALRFPDIVTVEFVAVAEDRSSLAIYSRSRYGRGDFGTNRRRVLRWLREIEELTVQ